MRRAGEARNLRARESLIRARGHRAAWAAGPGWLSAGLLHRAAGLVGRLAGPPGLSRAPQEVSGRVARIAPAVGEGGVGGVGPGRGQPQVVATGDVPPQPMRQLPPHPAARGAFRSEPEFCRARHLKPQKQPKQDLTGDAIAQHTPMMMQWCMYHC